MIPYKVVGCRSPKHPDEKYYKGTAVKSGELNFEKLAKRINNSTTDEFSLPQNHRLTQTSLTE